ncbi:ankyrin repeat-containing protein [Tanacetum coccineum]|uniref:Ankyrin repeat-containing protein n=1 Tax=Tanacetum coccineum TaxID=301880 RepID=A0ABQ5FXL6_9ASTR
MDRLVKADVNELNLMFTKNQKCSTSFKLTNLMHTMSVAISLNTTNQTIFSFTQAYSIIPPLGTSTFTLNLAKPCDIPPLSTPLDNVLVRSSMLPTGKASQEELKRLFSKPGPYIFKDVTIPISFVGPHVIEFLTCSSMSKTLEIAFVLTKAITWCDESQLTSLLRRAVMHGNCYVVSSLLDAGADVNIWEPDGESVMLLAVKSGDIDTVKLMVESGFVIDEHDRLLHDAASMNRVDIMEVLCMGYLDLDINLVDSEGQTPLHIGATHGYVEVLKFLVELGIDPDLVDNKGWTPLHCASSNGHVEAIEFLLDSCNYVKYAVNKEGKTAYNLAVEKGYADLYDMLHLGDVLHRASRKGDVDEMKKCLEDGAKVNGKDQHGWTALHRAAFKGYIDGAKVLLNNGARVDLVDGSGYTALHRAVEAGHVQLAMILIGHGAKANMKSLVVPFDLDSVKKHPVLEAPIRHMIERA